MSQWFYGGGESTRHNHHRTPYILFFIVFCLCFLLYQIIKIYDVENSFDPIRQSEPKPLIKDEGNKSQVKYVIVVDAGSAGTRIHVFSLQYENNTIQALIKDVFFEIPKAISNYFGHEGDLERDIFHPFLIIAKENIPVDQYKKTIVSVKATAGLRLFPHDRAERILIEIRSIIAKWPFSPEKFSLDSAVSVIDGKNEGISLNYFIAIWSWISLNYLLGTINAQNLSAVNTVAAMDLGGASMQVVFEITPEEVSKLTGHPHSVLSVITFGGRTFHLFQNSFLKYGLNQARLLVNAENYLASLSPCSPEKPYTVNVGKYINNLEKLTQLQEEMSGEESSDGDDLSPASHRIQVVSCLEQIRKILKIDQECYHPCCFFAGVPAPSLSPFQNMKLFAFSNFQERLHPFKFHSANNGEQFELTMGEIWNYIYSHCDRSSITADQMMMLKHSYTRPSLSLRIALKTPHFCMDNLFIYSLLLDGFKIRDPNYKINFVKKINGIEVCWALGAAIQMVDEHGTK